MTWEADFGEDVLTNLEILSCSSTLVKVYLSIFDYLKPQERSWHAFLL